MTNAATSPRVTVVIPTHNRAALLREALDSVLAQTYRDFVVVVADNASTDETPDVVAGYADDRVRLERRAENLGLFGNFQNSLRRVETDYAVLLPDDDVLRPEFLASTIDVVERNPRVGIVHTAFDVIDDHGRVLESAADWTYGLDGDTVERSDVFLAESMRWGCRVCLSATLMRTAAIPDPPFDERDMPAIDFGLWLRMALDWDVAFVAQPLAAYRVHGSAVSATLGVPLEAGYRTGVEWVDRRAEVKQRFLAAHADRLADRDRLRRLARRGRTFELVAMARKATLPQRRPLATLRNLARAARVDPAVATHPDAWRLAAASMIGPRLVDRLKGRA